MGLNESFEPKFHKGMEMGQTAGVDVKKTASLADAITILGESRGNENYINNTPAVIRIFLLKTIK